MTGKSTQLSDPFGWVGTVIDGKYRVDAVVGEGGFGFVYAGHHLGFDEPIAIKCLRLDDAVPVASRERFLAGFRDEGRILFRLSRGSPHIVTALDCGAATSPTGAWTPYLIMEWVRGGNLHQDLEARARARLCGRSLQETLELLEPAAIALEAAHKDGIAHCDAKPANFVIAEANGRRSLKVLDFGVAKVMNDPDAVAGGPASARGAGTALRGFTPAYGAPEQFDPRFGSTGPWTDVFALALVFVEVAAGRHAYDESDVQAYGLQASDPGRRPTLRTLGLATSDAVERVLQRALAVEPRNRFTRAGEFWAALRAAVEGRQLEAHAAPPMTVEAAGPKRTDVPDYPLTTPGVPPPTMTQVPPIPVTVPDYGAVAQGGSLAQPAATQGSARRARRWGGLLVVGGLVVFAGALVPVALWLAPGASPQVPAGPPHTGPPRVSPAGSSTSGGTVGPTCSQPCCGGSMCDVTDDNSGADGYAGHCVPGQPRCHECQSHLSCIPGTCSDPLPAGAAWDLRLSWVGVKTGGSQEPICKSPYAGAVVCFRVGGGACANVLTQDACDHDAGALTTVRVTTEDVLQQRVGVEVRDRAGVVLATGRLSVPLAKRHICTGYVRDLVATPRGSGISKLGFFLEPVGG